MIRQRHWPTRASPHRHPRSLITHSSFTLEPKAPATAICRGRNHLYRRHRRVIVTERNLYIPNTTCISRSALASRGQVHHGGRLQVLHRLRTDLAFGVQLVRPCCVVRLAASASIDTGGRCSCSPLQAYLRTPSPSAGYHARITRPSAARAARTSAIARSAPQLACSDTCGRRSREGCSHRSRTP